MIFYRTLMMSYVEALNIMIYPAYGQFKFQGTWAEYKQYKAMKRELVQVVNAKGTDDDGSMIQYWIDKSQYEFDYGLYICPATGDLLNRDGLDGAHVEIVGYPNMGLFITPVQKGFNRSHTRSSFFVKPEYLVDAPKE